MINRRTAPLRDQHINAQKTLAVIDGEPPQVPAGLLSNGSTNQAQDGCPADLEPVSLRRALACVPGRSRCEGVQPETQQLF